MRTIPFILVLLLLSPAALAALPASLQQDAGQPGDAGNDAGSARAVAAPSVVRGELSAPADASDWYSFGVPAGAAPVVSLEARDGVTLRLLDPAGAVAGTTSSVTASSATLVGPAVAGTWRVHVRSSGAQLPYAVHLVLDPTTPVNASHVVVATFDTGTNPFHPCFRRPALEDPHSLVPGIPADLPAIRLTFAESYAASLAQSGTALSQIQPWTLYRVPGTNLLSYGGASARNGFVDTYPHGAQASSQIACAEYGLAPNALLVVVDWYENTGDGPKLIRWAADQPWIDVIHLNIQDWPLVAFRAPEVNYAVAKGKVVVVAAGNGVGGLGPNYPSELSKWNGPPGTLVAGANENGGWTAFSNLNPDVVMDGSGTVSASPNSYGSTSFSGTSSASPRISGYVARLLGEARKEFGHTGVGLLTIPADRARPLSGPLADGVLTAEEMHAVVRKTADPNPYPSRYDGGTSSWGVPQPAEAPFAVYAKMGYGEVSEATLPRALDVLAGRAPMPERPVEDAFREAGMTFRRAHWG